MKLTQLYILSAFFLLTNCVTVSNQMSELKPAENYSTQHLEVKDKSAMPAQIIFANGETVAATIRGQKNPFHGILTETSITKYFPIYDNTGKTQYINFNLIKELTIKDFKGEERKFVNMGSDSNSLWEVMYEGTKTNWYKEYSNSSYDQSIQVTDYFMEKNGNTTKVSGLKSMKNQLRKLTASKPHLEDMIDSSPTLGKLAIINILREHDK